MAKYQPGKKRKTDKKLHLDKDLARTGVIDISRVTKRFSAVNDTALNESDEDVEMVDMSNVRPFEPIVGERSRKETGQHAASASNEAIKRPHKEDEIKRSSSTEDKEKKKMSRGLKTFFVILIILAIIVGGGYLALNLMLSPSKKTTLDKSRLGITEGLDNSGAEKVLLFGIDGDENYSGGRSDTIIIAAANPKTKKLKLISILRDTRVQLDDFGLQKINAAYAYGGPALAVNTVNRNFRQDITNYISVDFSRLSEIVDMVGGVDIEITAAEAEQINGLCPEEEYVYEGLVKLNGAQAVAFSRIRSIDSDYERTGRQHKVINAVFQSAKSLSITQYPSFIGDLFDTVETSMGMTDVLKMALLFRNYEVESYAVPDPEFETDAWGGIDENGMWVWIYDFDAAADRIQRIITE